MRQKFYNNVQIKHFLNIKVNIKQSRKHKNIKLRWSNLLGFLFLAFTQETVHFSNNAFLAVPIDIILWRHLNANANPVIPKINEYCAKINIMKSYQWYQASQSSQPIIGLPSSGPLHDGQIQTLFPASSCTKRLIKCTWGQILNLNMHAFHWLIKIWSCKLLCYCSDFYGCYLNDKWYEFWWLRALNRDDSPRVVIHSLLMIFLCSTFSCCRHATGFKGKYGRSNSNLCMLSII